MSQLRIIELDFVELVSINRDDFQKLVGGNFQPSAPSYIDIESDIDADVNASVEKQGNDTLIFVGKSFARAEALSFGGRAKARANARQR